ncbi:MAG TPA: ATP-binding cassette domain-containing protein [Solirubrobacteraceae bacterium]
MLFSLRDVSVDRGGRPVLRNLSLDLAEGATAVVGPSGCGKSTLLRLLNRLADPDAGAVRFRGRDVRSLDPLALRRDVALVPQLPALLPGTVADNLRFAARLAETEIDGDVLVRVGLDDSFADRAATRLSVGEQQRAMLARALVQRPSVLLLDEPTSALDPAARDAVEATLRRLRAELGLSTVLVTHDPAQAERLADGAVRLAAP